LFARHFYRRALHSFPTRTLFRSDVVAIPCSRRRRAARPSRRPHVLDAALDAALATPGDPLMAPLRVVWLAPLRGGSRETGFLERSEEHTSELQSREKLVCRLLLE